VHGFRCYDNIAPNGKCQRVLVLALCLVTARSELRQVLFLALSGTFFFVYEIPRELLLSCPYTSIVMADKAFSVCAPKIWNDLSFNCRPATTVSSFKRNLKRELFYTAYADHSQ